MVARVIHTTFRTILDQVFQERETFKDNTPSSGTLVFQGFPRELRDNGKLFVIVRVAGDFVQEGARSAPVLVRKDFVDAGFDFGFGFGLIETVVWVRDTERV